MHGGDGYVRYRPGPGGDEPRIRWAKIKSIDRAVEKAVRVYGQASPAARVPRFEGPEGPAGRSKASGRLRHRAVGTPLADSLLPRPCSIGPFTWCGPDVRGCFEPSSLGTSLSYPIHPTPPLPAVRRVA